MELWAITSQGEKKVGQCAVGMSRGLGVFSDGIQLLPGVEHRWSAAMAAVVQHLGPAKYVYGSEWSVEPPRETLLEAMPGVTVDQVRKTSVQVINFKRWNDFDAYRMAVSSNVRRNVKKAEKSYASLEVVLKAGLSKIPYFLKSTALRRTLFRRKGVERSTAGMLLRSAARLVSLKRYSRSAYLIADDTLLASYVGINFGNTYCYLEGASNPDSKGAAWYLLMGMIQHAFAQSDGHGLFVMGSDDGSQEGVASWEGLRRSRQSLCATPMPTSVVRFTFVKASAVASDGPQTPAVRAAAASTATPAIGPR